MMFYKFPETRQKFHKITKNITNLTTCIKSQKFIKLNLPQSWKRNPFPLVKQQENVYEVF